MGSNRGRRLTAVFPVALGHEELLVIVLPTERFAGGGALSVAERAVVEDAARGLSNLEIARRRRRSQRTIANQLASAFRKLGVTSRADLVARLARRHAE